MDQKSITQVTLKNDFGINNRPILAFKLLNVATIFCKIFYQNDGFFRNSAVQWAVENQLTSVL